MKLRALFVGAFALALTGCIIPKSYVDPKYDSLSFETVEIASDTSYDITTSFQRNGKENAGGAKQVAKVTEKFLAKSGINNVPEGQKLKITVNNITNMGAAAGKGFATGLTLGLAGSTVTDGYEFTFELEGEGETVSKTYGHALHTTVGNTSAPFDNVESTTPLAGFEAIFEDMFLKFIQETNETEGEAIAWFSPSIDVAP